MRRPELCLDHFRFSALGLVHAERLLTVVVTLVFLAQEFYFIAYKREAYHDPPGVVVDGDALFNHVLLEGFLQALGFFSCGLSAHSAVAAGVTPEVGNVSYVPLVYEALQLG
jgi:hypothetical protein